MIGSGYAFYLQLWKVMFEQSWSDTRANSWHLEKILARIVSANEELSGSPLLHLLLLSLSPYLLRASIEMHTRLQQDGMRNASCMDPGVRHPQSHRQNFAFSLKVNNSVMIFSTVKTSVRGWSFSQTIHDWWHIHWWERLPTCQVVFQRPTLSH